MNPGVLVPSVIVIQARIGSSRLPAKVLLPIAGMPLVVLAAKRAANTGLSVLVATSIETEDDVLCEVLHDYGIQFFRGSLENTLDRMVETVQEYDDETVFIRLTADNFLPDGHLIDEVINEFQNRSLDYLCCNDVPSGLPYGMSVEVTRLKYLREAALSTTDKYDQEHVTPYVIRKFGATYFDKYKSLEKGHFRCTVDLFEDYINACEVFRGETEPVSLSCFDLIKKLEGLKYQPLQRKPVPQLVFGAVQLGMDYGIANSHGQPNISQAEYMLKMAINNGVEYIDTARAYGNSESVIGQCLERGWSERVKIITKLDPLDFPENTDSTLIQSKVDLSVFESCFGLKLKSIEVLMLHRATHFFAWGGVAWKRLLELQGEGIIKYLGVSVQTPEELETALNFESISFIQMPFNLLDWRWNELQEQIISVKNQRRLIIHARSALLQGLLLCEDTKSWSRAHISEQKTILGWLQKQSQLNGCNNIVDLCLGYVRSKSWIDGVVLGMETKEQLIKNIHSLNLSDLNSDQILEIEQTRPRVDEKTLDPSKWLGT